MKRAFYGTPERVKFIIYLSNALKTSFARLDADPPRYSAEVDALVESIAVWSSGDLLDLKNPDENKDGLGTITEWIECNSFRPRVRRRIIDEIRWLTGDESFDVEVIFD